MELKMKCDKCSKMVAETSTSSCTIGSFEVSDYLPELDKNRSGKLCSFNDHFFCSECMVGSICQDCYKVLSKDEIEILKQADKI